MRKIIVGMFVSLDGVMEGPGSASDFALAGWTDPYWDAEVGNFVSDAMNASDALLLGRVTYQGFAAAFSDAPADDPGATIMNNYRKYVVSTTLETVEWQNSTLIKGNVMEEIAALKQQPGKNISISGSGQLVHALMQHDLIDEYRLLVYPVILGQGKRLFPDGINVKLNLVTTKTSDSGVVLLTYQPARSA